MPEVLSEHEWTARATAHRARVETFTGPHGRRAQRGEAHPVWDFLFSYYSLRPRQLRVWHPGYGTALAGPAAAEYLDRAGYAAGADGVTVSPEFLSSRRDTVGFVADLLRATEDRAPQFGCFGMHEWAMVYRADAVRHDRVPLRLGSAGTDAVVESMPLRCTHFDAFRFFTDGGRAAQPRRADPSRPARLGTAGVPARQHGPVQVVLQARPAGRLASCWWTVWNWPPKPASSTCAPAPTT